MSSSIKTTIKGLLFNKFSNVGPLDGDVFLGLTQNFLFNIKKWIFFPLVKSDISGKVIKNSFLFFKLFLLINLAV